MFYHKSAEDPTCPRIPRVETALAPSARRLDQGERDSYEAKDYRRDGNRRRRCCLRRSRGGKEGCSRLGTCRFDPETLPVTSLFNLRPNVFRHERIAMVSRVRRL